jgi:hypothetical protein
MKALRKLLFLVALLLTLAGCATTIVTRVVIQPVQDMTDTKSMIDAITYVLTNNGFDVAFINEKYGLINSDWRPIQSTADTAASVISILGSAMSKGPSSYSTYSRDMMISFQIFANEYHVIPKLKRKTNTTSFYGGSNREDVEYPTADSNEGKLVTKIISEINRLLRVPDDIQWEEKVVRVGEEPQ